MKPIKRLVRSHVNNAALLSNVGAEISFQLPNDASASFEGMLTEIDARKAELKINRCDRCMCMVVCVCVVFVVAGAVWLFLLLFCFHVRVLSGMDVSAFLLFVCSFCSFFVC